MNRDKYEVTKLGEGIGYGNMMHLAQACWKESLARQGYPTGGEFIVGTCVAMTVPCGCERYSCDWCCGSGWLTKHVKEVKDREDEC